MQKAMPLVQSPDTKQNPRVLHRNQVKIINPSPPTSKFTIRNILESSITSVLAEFLLCGLLPARSGWPNTFSHSVLRITTLYYD